MRVRAIRECSQRLYDGDRIHILREGWEGDWKGSGELPKCFRRLSQNGEVIPNEEDEPAKAAEKPPAPPMLHGLDRDSQIMEALNRLDHRDNGVWTSLGLPLVEAVSLELEALGFDPSVTRADINVASPGFQREPLR